MKTLFDKSFKKDLEKIIEDTVTFITIRNRKDIYRFFP